MFFPGFSRYLGLLSSSVLQPTLSHFSRSITSDLHASLRADAAPPGLARALSDPVGDSGLDAGPGVDAGAAAAKAGWLLRMAEAFAGEEAFK